MITFFAAIAILIGGYFLYSRRLERIAGIDPTALTPAAQNPDGVDYVPLPWYRVFLIQFLNIAGLGPIFGAVAGAMWGPVVFLWIAFGAVLIGAVHDYLAGMLSERHNGASIGEVVGEYLGPTARILVRGWSVVLLVLVGAIFVSGPARLLANLTPDGLGFGFWTWVIFLYYILATLLPINQLIGRVYPLFGLALLIMAIGVAGALLLGDRPMVELSPATLANLHHKPDAFPIFPMLFVAVACGAVSGFHSTQAPMMARCLTHRHHGRRVFFGSMIAEGVVAVIWAAAAITFFGGVEALNAYLAASGHNVAGAVNDISRGLLGGIGGVLVILGVVACPITTGDTAFRSARLTVADFLRLPQGPIRSRLLVCLPLFAFGVLLTQIDFGVIWRYFAWANQSLAVFVLWTAAAALARGGRSHYPASLPALFMSAVCLSYILVAPEGLRLPVGLGVGIGVAAALGVGAAFELTLLRRAGRVGRTPAGTPAARPVVD